MAYYRAVTDFFAWVDHHKIGQLVDIEPLHVAAYVEALGSRMAKPTVKQHLAAIRMLFDWLVTGGILTVNPAHAVRGPKHVIKRGKRRGNRPAAIGDANTGWFFHDRNFASRIVESGRTSFVIL
jgi:site-specific recombinase XerC